MSAYDEVVLYCEDVAGRPSVRLLELARAHLVGEVPIAASVDIRPFGSEANLRPVVRLEREQGRRAFAVRDRDFLTRALVDGGRAKHFERTTDVAPWPLSRHCIESYLLEQTFLERALPDCKVEWAVVLEELARGRRWTDLARATIQDLNWRLRNLRGRRGTAEATSRDEAIALVRAASAGVGPGLTAELTEERFLAKLNELDRDFDADGPLACRVDGRKLLGALEERLGLQGSKGGLLNALLRHAERRDGGPPSSLVGDVRALLLGMGSPEIR